MIRFAEVEQSENREMYPLEARKHFEGMNVLEGCYIKCHEKWSVPNLRYSYHRMYYICGGEAYYEENDKRERLLKGHLYIFPSQSKRYSVNHDPSDPLRVIWCHFEVFPDIVNDIIDFDPSGDEDIKLLLEVWKRMVSLSKPGNEIFSIVTLILYMLERRVGFQYADFPFSGVEKYVSEHIRESVTVASMAGFFGYTRAHFSRKFKAAYNLSPGEYLRVVRMSRAANMLQHGFDISRVCAELGFTDRKVFSRAFKTYHSLTPTEFIKRHKLQP